MSSEALPIAWAQSSLLAEVAALRGIVGAGVMSLALREKLIQRIARLEAIAMQLR